MLTPFDIALRGSSSSGVIAAARGTVSVPIGPVGALEGTKMSWPEDCDNG